MTEEQAILNFKIELNKLDRSSLIDVRREKITHYLNKAALFLVKKKYKGSDPGPGKLEVMHPLLDDLKTLLKEVTVDLTGITLTSTETVIPFVSDHLYYISSRFSTVTAACTTAAWHEGRYVKPERVYKELESPFNKSKFDDPMVSIVNDNLVVYDTDFTLEGVKVKYLSAPRTIVGGVDGQGAVIEMELPFGDEIIDIGVAMALENFESERIKTQPSINVASASE